MGVPYILGNLAWGCHIPWGAKYPVTPVVFGTSARSEFRRGKAALGFLGVYTSMRNAFLLTERVKNERRARVVSTNSFSRVPEKRDVHNNALVHIYYNTHSSPGSLLVAPPLTRILLLSVVD